MLSDETLNHDKQDKKSWAYEKHEKGGYPAADFR